MLGEETPALMRTAEDTLSLWRVTITRTRMWLHVTVPNE
jgi:hypothetical protein